ncbi:hypothetical protein BKP37_12820 [Anaerobacillus alkalilacustris]|uniref:Uncharacterized protein n=1 Tax=Anaerobacillus alkalilacustris TaxID=393763 RepID=A0A1S2LJG9_9BACI|nr:hypothetical protein [Anaerobacillus alkalilacustris]OIJ12679.1 hypothetical protein BKP37_12820 [Anaerobacillus alkalilacustris]
MSAIKKGVFKIENQLWMIKAVINKGVIEGAVIEKEVEARWPIEAVEKFKKKNRPLKLYAIWFR